MSQWCRQFASYQLAVRERAVLDAERCLSAVSVKGASLQDRLAYVSLFAKVGYGRGCHALHCDTRRMAVCVCPRCCIVWLTLSYHVPWCACCVTMAGRRRTRCTTSMLHDACATRFSPASLPNNGSMLRSRRVSGSGRATWCSSARRSRPLQRCAKAGCRAATRRRYYSVYVLHCLSGWFKLVH